VVSACIEAARFTNHSAVPADRREVPCSGRAHQVKVTSRSSSFGRFMQITSMQNCIGVDSQTMVGKKSEGSAEYGRDMQRRCCVDTASMRSHQGPVALRDLCRS
jgi:hypothetical protein